MDSAVVGAIPLTWELRLRGNLCEQLCKVREIIRKEFGLENDVFARVLRGKLTAQQFYLPSDPQRRPFKRGLSIDQKRVRDVSNCGRW